MFHLLEQLLFDYTLRNVALGAAVLGIVSGALGSFAVLRKQSLLGDTISHAALPGIALAFLITGMKSTLVLLIGAGITGWLATIAMITVVRTTRVKEDSALGLVLSVFFGLGLVLLTLIQRRPDATQAGLEKFLFGQAATLLASDVQTMAIMGSIALLVTAILWKEFKLLSFDPEFGATIGLPVRFLDVALLTLLVVAIVVGLQTVGVVLMSAMVVAPAAAARQWTDRLSVMVLLSAALGALGGVSGAIISSLTTRLPTGPTIVICMTVIVIVSLMLAPARGMLWRWLRQRRNRMRFREDVILLDLYELAQQHRDKRHGHSIAVLKTINLDLGVVKRSLAALHEQGLVVERAPGIWGLTDSGIDRASRITYTTEVNE